MNKTVVIHQPDFLPYLGFFHRLLYADVFVVLDDVQFLRRGWHHRDKIKTSSGEKWITVGVKKAPQDTKISEILLNESSWKQDHLHLFKVNYEKSAFFGEILPYVEELYKKEFDKMIDFNMESIFMLLNLFDIKIPIKYSSTYSSLFKANELLIDILKNENTTHYLSGVGAKDYYDEKPFKKANIEVVWQDFKHPVYKQINGNFIPYLSSIDILFNCGIEESRKILRSI